MNIINPGPNSEEKSQIWIDVTHLITWRKSFTGIQRAQFMYSKLGVEKFNAKLFKIDSNTKTIQIVDLNELLKPKKKSFNLIFSKIIYRVKIEIIKYFNLNKNKKIFLPFQKNDLVLSLGVFWVDPSINSITNDLISKNVQIVTMIFDLIPILMPEFFTNPLKMNFQISLENMLKNSSTIIAISKNTKTDIINYCQKQSIDIPNIKVIRLGEDLFTELTSQPIKLLNNKKFILYVSTIEPRKNHERLLNVWQKIHLKHPDCLLILFGKSGWLNSSLINQIQYLEIKSQLVWIKDGADNELKWLYENCLFTIYPSLYEGWGLPVAESMALKKYCICSSSSSLPEIAGNAVSYFNPNNEFEMETKINHLIEISTKDRLPEFNYKMTTWSDSTEKLFHFLNNCSFSIK